jgi:hypothetical protein
VKRPRNSTLILLGCFVATLVLYLAVRPDPEPESRTQETNPSTTLVPAVGVPVDEAPTATAPPEEEETPPSTEDEEESTTTTADEGSTTSTSEGEDRSGAGTTSTSEPTTGGD